MRYGPFARVLAALGALAGCPPDLDRFHLASSGTDGGDPESDAGEPGGDSGPLLGGPCEVPHLLVAVESLEGGAGRVLRFELADDGAVRRCGDLGAAGEIASMPLTLAWLDDERVAVASDVGIQMLDPTGDSLVWSTGGDGLWPRDAFVLEEPGIGRRLAIAVGQPGIDDLREIRVYDGDGGVTRSWPLNGGDLPLGLGVYGVTQSPVHRERLLAVKLGGYAAAEVDPWEPAGYTAEPWVRDRKGVVFSSISALESDGLNRVAWVGVEAGASGVYYLFEPTGQPGQTPSMGIGCGNRECSFVHAVPDPTLNTRLFAICAEGSERDLVRFTSTGGECEVIVSAADLEGMGSMGLGRLAVAWEAQ